MYIQIPGAEGRAGMVAIVDVNNTLDKTALCKKLKENLPSYAMPIFLRIMKSLPMTGTFKLKKLDLQKEGYNINTVTDDIYYYNATLKNYELLTQKVYSDIVNGKLRL